MKHNRRFLLVALALVLVSLLAFGTAYAKPEIQPKADGSDDFYYGDEGDWLDSWAPTWVDPSDVPEGFTGFKFTSSDEKVITVNENLWKGGSSSTSLYKQGPGTATITATAVDENDKDLGVTGTWKYTLKELKAKDITVEYPFAEMTVNSTWDFSWSTVINPADGIAHSYRYEDIKWTVSDTTLARITSKGVLKALKPGTVTVTATLKQDAKVTGKVDINITENETQDTTKAISFNSDKFEVTLTEALDLSDYLTVEPAGSTVIWTTSDPTVATVTNAGELSLKKLGKAEITATIKGSDVSAKVEINIVEVRTPLTALSFKPDSVKIPYSNESYDLKSSYLVTEPATGYDSRIIWSVDDTSVGYATVNSNGQLKMQKPGTVKVTATSKDNEKVTATITVEILAPALEKITFTQKEFVMDLYTGYTLTNFWIVEPQNSEYTLTWTSSDVSVATVEYGTVTAVKVGTAVITATDKKSGVTASVNVTVKDSTVQALAFSQKTYTLPVGNPNLSLGDFLTVDPYDASTSFTWTSSDVTVATVSNGKVNPLKAGTAVITATDKKSGKSDSITITVTDSAISALAFSQATYTLPIGNTNLNLKDFLTITPYNYSSDDGLAWSSSDIAIATVYDGKIIANKAGTATITVTSKLNPATVYAALTLTVTDTPVETVAFKQAAYTLYVDDKLYLSDLVTCAPVGYNYKGITFSSSDRDVATIEEEDDFGAGTEYIRAWKEGTSTITVSVRNYDETVKKATCTLTVKSRPVEAFSFAKTDYTLTLRGSGSDWLDLGRRLVVTPDDRDWADVFADDPDALIWTSSDETVATVNAWEDDGGSYGYDGVVRPVSAGTAVITVTYAYNPAVTASVNVTVKTAPVSKVTLNKTAFTEEPGVVRSKNIIATIQPANAYVKETYWKTSDKTVAYVSDYEYDEDITLNTGKAGKATLTFCVDDGITVHEASIEVTVCKDSADLQIRVKDPYEDSYADPDAITKLDLPLRKDKTLNKNIVKLIAFSNDYTYSKNELAWSSSNTKILTIDKFGRITVKKEGKAKITVTLKDGSGKSATISVNVVKNLIKKFNGPDAITLRVKERKVSLPVEPVGKKANLALFNKLLKYKSSNPDVVSVDANGYLYANKIGSATITIQAQDGSKKKFSIKVNVIAAEQ